MRCDLQVLEQSAEYDMLGHPQEVAKAYYALLFNPSDDTAPRNGHRPRCRIARFGLPYPQRVFTNKRPLFTAAAALYGGCASPRNFEHDRWLPLRQASQGLCR